MGAPQLLTRSALQDYQLGKANETLALARQTSPFYRKLFADIPRKALSNLQDLRDLPFTSGQDIQHDSLRFLCVSHARIARVVTLQTSGNTHRPKRLFFTDADLELTIDFFHHGMATLVEAGQRVMILLPGHLPGSVGDLLARALSRMDVTGVVHGPVQDAAATLEEIQKRRIDSLIGIPVQVLALVRHEKGAMLGKGKIKSVLLSTDYVPQAVVEELETTWKCQVFEHYGMTEMGLGGGVECAVHHGYHLREADLFFEIVDPQTGCRLPDGITGEVVFTTLTREGMPLIRYRTGDMAAFIAEPCPCGSILRRLGKIEGRNNAGLSLGGKHTLRLRDLDESLFAVKGLKDYRIEVDCENGKDRLTLTVYKKPEEVLPGLDEVRQAILMLEPIRKAIRHGAVSLNKIYTTTTAEQSGGMSKRTIIDNRKRI
jgi:phenylacetate-CoA ligase